MQNVYELLLAYRKKKAAGISTNTKPDSQIFIKPLPPIPVSKEMLLRHFSVISMLSFGWSGGIQYLKK